MTKCRALERLAGAGGLCLAAMSLWEAQMLHAKGRLVLDRPLASGLATHDGATQRSGVIPIWTANG